MINKLVLFIGLSLLLSACATTSDNPTTRIEQTLPSGDVITAVVSSKDFADAQKVASAELSRTECYKAMSAPLSSEVAQVAREVRLAAGKGLDCGNSYNDALIAKEVQKTERTKTRWGTGKSIITGSILGGVAYKGIDTLGDVVKAGIENAGSTNTVNVDNESTYQGAQGESATYTEQVAVSEETEEPEIEVTDEESCLAAGGEPVFDENGQYERCSDGEGGDL